LAQPPPTSPHSCGGHRLTLPVGTSHREDHSLHPRWAQLPPHRRHTHKPTGRHSAQTTLVKAPTCDGHCTHSTMGTLSMPPGWHVRHNLRWARPTSPRCVGIPPTLRAQCSGRGVVSTPMLKVQSTLRGWNIP
jgi:hypothetical protein